MTDHPPRPRLCLRIGVTGHRPGEKLLPANIATVTTTVGAVLDQIKIAITETAIQYAKYFQREANDRLPPFDLAIVSSLADGADRIVAQAGLDRGFLLDVVLPFARDTYADDFTAVESNDQFYGLLKKARSTFELDGKRDKAPRAYEAAGLVMLANVDVLIAVWDGKDPAGIGGTALIVEKAVGAHVPVVLIEPAEATKASLLWTAENKLAPSSSRVEDLARNNDALRRISDVVNVLVAPPTAKKARESLDVYLREKQNLRHFPLGSVYPLFLQCFLGKRMRSPDLWLNPYQSGTEEDWKNFFEPDEKTKSWPLDSRLSPQIKQVLLPAVSFADNLAVLYAGRYRGVYVATFMLAAVAVGFGLSGVYLHEHPEVKVWWVVAELGTIGLILYLWLRGWAGDWHRRWLEYRRLGESLRYMRVLTLVGASGSVGRSLVSSESGSEWLSWYAQALRRALPVPNQVVNPNFLEQVRARVLAAEVEGQIRYNKNNAARMKRMERHIHAVGLLLLTITCMVGGLFVYQFYVGRDFHSPAASYALENVTFLAALLPTIGAALHAIRVQADFETVAHRSIETIRRLDTIKKAMLMEQLDFALLADRINKAVDAMATDLDEWQVLFRTRPLSPPV